MNYQIIDRYIDRLIAETTPDAPIWNIENIRHGKKPGWNYIDGCMMTSLYTIYKQTGDRKYLDSRIFQRRQKLSYLQRH